ncbi:MAG: ABC transporter substrate-binding protein [Acidimicrobiales bacterium]
MGRSMGKRRLRVWSLAAALSLLIGAVACGSGPKTTPAGGIEVRMAYLPNLTHAAAIVGVEEGIFDNYLGANRLETHLFNAGPDIVGAIFSGAIDFAYLGPNPTINAFDKSGGDAIRVVAGATSGGAALVVQPTINTAEDLRGRRIGTPQLGGTQDVAAREWLRKQGLSTSFEGGGDVSVQPQENAGILESFRAGTLAGAWVPEPWASRLVLEGGGKVLVDERSLWPEGRFVTTNVVVSARLLRDHPDVVARLVESHLMATKLLMDQPDQAKVVLNEALASYTGKAIPPEVLDRAWSNLEFTDDPIESSLHQSAGAAYRVGLFDHEPVLEGLYDLRWRDQARDAVAQRSMKL